MRYRLKPGDRVRVGGGYSLPPDWLGGRTHVTGTVVRAGLDRNGTAAVQLDEELSVVLDRGAEVLRASGCYLIVSPRYRQRWWSPGSSRIAHLELHETEPTGDDTGSGAWIESHASYRVLPRESS